MTAAATLPSTPLEIQIFVESRDASWDNQSCDMTQLCRTAAAEALKMSLELSGRVEISIVLADDEFVRDLNKSWRGVDAPTNVLAFPGAADDGNVAEDAEKLLGDVVVAFQRTQQEAIEQNISFEDHVAHLIVHGVLHLLGYDHKDDRDATVMEKLEVDILAGLGINDPYDLGD